jgi:hypothetical protein
MLQALIDTYNRLSLKTTIEYDCDHSKYHRYCPYSIPMEHEEKYQHYRKLYSLEKKIIQIFRNSKLNQSLWKEMEYSGIAHIIIHSNAPSHRSLLLWDPLDPLFFIHYSHIY